MLRELRAMPLEEWLCLLIQQVIMAYSFFFSFFFFFYLWLHWVFIAACGLFSSCGELGLLFVAVRGLLTVVASLVVEHGL